MTTGGTVLGIEQQAFEDASFPQPTLSVGELADVLKAAFGSLFPTEIWIQGEIRSLNRSRAGHVYFDLVEPAQLGRSVKASISVALFDSARRDVNEIITRAGDGVRMADGIQIRIRAKVDFYGAQGRTQLIMSSIDPDFTLGRLAADRDKLLADLASEGLLDQNTARPLSEAPLRVGLITSVDSAAYRDFMDELEASGIGWDLVVVDSRVQGSAAPLAVSRAIRTVARRSVDVVAIVRGGGSKTDLAAFDHEMIARCVAECAAPVWTGIGHEVDDSVTDRVAHTAFKTPTACAAGLVERVRAHVRQLDERWNQIAERADQHLQTAQRRLVEHTARIHRSVEAGLRRGDDRLTSSTRRLEVAAPRQLDSASQRLDVIAARVHAVDPARTLARGWSITRDADGRVIRRGDQVDVGAELVTSVESGTITSVVTDTSDTPGGTIDE